ncbi:MAG: Phage Tail Collar [Patescibacteria group bacterium]|nr:Phage Tail Collar [Patescibacteria group bacterium]
MDAPEISDENVTDAMGVLIGGLPKPVQEFLLSDERNAVASELSNKYGLHADQAGKFEEAYLHMLLGIATPEDFVSSLKKAGVQQEVINGLAADVNTRVFMRLRDAERLGTPITDTPPPTPSKPAPLPPPALDYQPAAVPTLPGSPVPAPMPPAPAVVAPVLAAAEPTPVPQPLAPQQHFVHTMPSSQQQQGWHPAAAVHIFVPTHGAPMQMSAPAPQAPVQETPVYNAAYSEPAPTVPVQPVYVNPEQTPVAPAAVIHKEYSADPYREPVQ